MDKYERFLTAYVDCGYLKEKAQKVTGVSDYFYDKMRAENPEFAEQMKKLIVIGSRHNRNRYVWKRGEIEPHNMPKGWGFV